MEILKAFPDSYLANGISFFGIQIRFYALCIGVGMLIALFLSLKEAKRLGVNQDDFLNGGLFGIFAGIVGARIYFVIFEWDYYGANLGEIFAIWNGGLAIHGGILAGIIFAYIYCKKTKMNYIKVLDILAIGLLIGQIFGRWGNFFNQEAHGSITTYEFLRNTLHLPMFIVKQMCIEGVYYHPTFLYESLWNLLALIALLILRRTRTIRQGDVFGIYLIWYSIGRFFIESLRTDSLMIGSIKQNQLISVILFIVGIVFIVAKYVKHKENFYVDNLDVLEEKIELDDYEKSLKERNLIRRKK